MGDESPPAALMIGTGEYTTGCTAGCTNRSDKKAGVVFLVMADLRRRGLVGKRLVLCGRNGGRMPDIRQHLRERVEQPYAGLSVAADTFPEDGVVDPQAFRAALASMSPGDLCTVFTPDDTHFEVALAAIERGLHVLVTKPVVKTLEQHRQLVEAARRRGVLLCVEVHKRYDPMYADARLRMRRMGDLSYFVSYMSQPKTQLATFRQWAGRASDISYYLNSHHVDFCCWALRFVARPERVTASCARGVAKEAIGTDAEDTITLQVSWRNLISGNDATSVFTASWAAPPSDVHSQQRFFCLCHRGEVNIDQAHRGYTWSTDSDPFGSVNPLFMRYTPDEAGRFVGQDCYGYRSFERFVEAVREIRAGRATPADFDASLPTAATCQVVSAVLEAGRLSLDHGGLPYRLVYEDDAAVDPVRVEAVAF